MVGTGRGDQGGINDRSLPHRYVPFAGVSPDGLKDLPSQPLLVEQVPKGKDRGLILDCQMSISLLQEGEHQLKGGHPHRHIGLPEKWKIASAALDLSCLKR